MRIAVWHNLPSGGGKRALYDHVRGLVERGHTVESWCPPTADQTYLPLSELITEHVVPFSWQYRMTKSRLAEVIASYRDVADNIKAMDRHSQQCAEEINRGGFDLLFANACMFFRVTSIGRYVSVPKVIYLGEPYRWLYEALPQLPWIALPPAEGVWWSPKYVKKFVRDGVKVQGLRLQAREELLNARAFDAILVNSHFSRESILRAYGLDAKVCYLGIDTSLFRHLNKQRERFIIGLASFDTIKGIDLAVRSTSLLAEPRPPLVWVSNSGDEEYINEVTELADRVGVNLQIRMRISDAELVDTLNRASLMIYTSHLEPFGLAPLEANACATPVVAVAEGGVRESVKDGVNGVLVEREPKAIADAIERLLRSPAEARRMGESAAAHVEQEWSLKRGVDRLEERLWRAVSNAND